VAGEPPRPRAIRGFAALGNLSPNVALGSETSQTALATGGKSTYEHMGRIVPGADVLGEMLPTPAIGHIARYFARRAKSGLGQFLRIPFAHAAALVSGPFFPTSDAMVSALLR
jgi:hypothetical protein